MVTHLNASQLHSFVKDGYLHLPAIVDLHKINECNRIINHLLGKPGELHAGGIQEGMGKLGGGLSNCKVVRSLYHDTGVRALAEQFLGAGNCDDANLAAQIALRFPEDASLDDAPSLAPTAPSARPGTKATTTPQWHTDGCRQGKLHPFSLLIGVCLSDAPEPKCGNLVVYPGAHEVVGDCVMGPHGGIDPHMLAARIANPNPNPNPHMLAARIAGQACQGDGSSDWTYQSRHPDPDPTRAPKSDPSIPPTTNHWTRLPPDPSKTHDNEPTLPPPGTPVSLITRSGDVLLLHPDLPHLGDYNLHHEIRRIAYFRLKIRYVFLC